MVAVPGAGREVSALRLGTFLPQAGAVEQLTSGERAEGQVTSEMRDVAVLWNSFGEKVRTSLA